MPPFACEDGQSGVKIHFFFALLDHSRGSSFDFHYLWLRISQTIFLLSPNLSNDWHRSLTSPLVIRTVHDYKRRQVEPILNKREKKKRNKDRKILLLLTRNETIVTGEAALAMHALFRADPIEDIKLKPFNAILYFRL